MLRLQTIAYYATYPVRQNMEPENNLPYHQIKPQ
jgi:hypothetical protein